MPTNLMVGQSGGPTAAINASLAGVIEQARWTTDIDTVLGMRRGIEGLLADQVIDLTNLPPSTIDVLARTPGAALGACRHKITDDEARGLVADLARRDVTVLCYIGGNDSAETARHLGEMALTEGTGLRTIAIPKTIDNDLPETDHCPGYGSAARFVAISACESTLDTRSLPTNYPVKIMEVMGRDAGWLAAATGLARKNDDDGPHLIYVPELPFHEDRFLEAVRAVHSRVGYVVIVVAETIRDVNGTPVARDVASVDMFGHPIVRGTAETLVRLVEKRLNLPARAEKPGSLQRSSWLAQSSTDLTEAREAGRSAVKLALSGASGRMVTIDRTSNEPYSTRMSSVDIGLIANKQRLLPREYLDAPGTGNTDAFRQYALPLLGPEPFPEFARLE